MRRKQPKRSGTTLVECAVVYPIVVLLIMGLVIGAMGIVRYQAVASLARRAARYAAVHSNQYAKDTGNKAATPDEIYQNVVLPNAVGCDPNKLSMSVTYANDKNYVYQTSTVNNSVQVTTNTVSVTVTYQWIPEAFLGSITLSSTSVMTISN